MGLHFHLTATQRDYVFSDKMINVIYSNTGEGKTFASVVAMLVHARRCGRPINCAIVRDTHENIKSATVRSIYQVFEQDPNILRFKNDFKQLTIFSDPKIEVTCSALTIWPPSASSRGRNMP
jgi:hypothetical protein